MALSQMILPEFDQEMANTRRVLERIPDDKLEWRAHEKSNTIAWLGRHLAEIPSWVSMTLDQDRLDLNPPGGEPWKPSPANSRDEILAEFDKNVAQARATIESADDAKLAESWTLLNGGREIFTMPKFAVLRSFVMNHIIHHRAQMCVYFRLTGVPIPALYGPSGDEGSF